MPRSITLPTSFPFFGISLTINLRTPKAAASSHSMSPVDSPSTPGPCDCIWRICAASPFPSASVAKVLEFTCKRTGISAPPFLSMPFHRPTKSLVFAKDTDGGPASSFGGVHSGR
jgi:hypothetical protein